MRREAGVIVVAEEECGLPGKERVGLPERREHGVIERAGGAERLREVEERRGSFLAQPLLPFLRARIRAVSCSTINATAKWVPNITRRPRTSRSMMMVMMMKWY